MVRRNFLALLQGWHRITLSDNRHVVHKLACLLFQAGAPVRRGESQDVKISSDYFDKVSNSEQSQHLGKPYCIACRRFLMLREFLPKEEIVTKLILCPCKTPGHVQDCLRPVTVVDP
jgi:hypothetical protein